MVAIAPVAHVGFWPVLAIIHNTRTKNCESYFWESSSALELSDHINEVRLMLLSCLQKAERCNWTFSALAVLAC
jgi:hypothetical protein